MQDLELALYKFILSTNEHNIMCVFFWTFYLVIVTKQDDEQYTWLG